MRLNLSKVESPLGKLLLVANEHARVRALDFADHQARLHRVLREHYVRYELVQLPGPHNIVNAVQLYFDDELAALDGIATATAGNELQHQVWAALRCIPAGQTISYGELARALGYDDPRMAVDIGAAIGANPIAIVVPCHRVIARNGGLKGYAWGLHRKRWLLEHEHALPPAQSMTGSLSSVARNGALLATHEDILQVERSDLASLLSTTAT